jgi:hypothetical protein
MEKISPYILFVVETPANDPGQKDSLRRKDFFSNALPGQPDWQSANNAQHSGQTQKPDEKPRTVRLAENVWLLSLQNDVRLLGNLVKRTEQYKFPYRYLVFDGEPSWQTLEPAS